MVARNKLRNPLLSVAQTDFDSFQAPALFVPVTPATPAVLQDGKIYTLGYLPDALQDEKSALGSACLTSKSWKKLKREITRSADG